MKLLTGESIKVLFTFQRFRISFLNSSLADFNGSDLSINIMENILDINLLADGQEKNLNYANRSSSPHDILFSPQDIL